MSGLMLYSRPDCHLCDEAVDLLAAVAPQQEFTLVDIEDDIQLLDRYGIRVPVLRKANNGEELGWPFDAQVLSAYLQR